MAFCCRCTPSTSSGTRIASTSTLLSQRRHASSAGKKGAAPPKKKQATISSSRKSAGSSGDGAGSETKTESLRKMLYGDDASVRKANDLARMAALRAVVPDPDAHETIVAAWQLHTQEKAEAHAAEMEARYESMRRAIDELQRTDPRTYALATQGAKFSTVKGTRGETGKKASAQGRIDGLFPRQMPVLG